eukprot:5267473-Pyramimonas_sp.AAC.1
MEIQGATAATATAFKHEAAAARARAEAEVRVAVEAAAENLRAQLAEAKAELATLRRENEQVKHLHSNQLAKVPY